jgi:hypothetical protein
MKGKLIKLNRGYYNLEDEKGNVIGTSYQFKSSVGDAIKYKLSQQNCDEIFGVVDVDKLAEENTEEFIEVFDYNDGRGNICRFNNSHQVQESYIKGFNKAMELNKDKLFTLDNIKEAIAESWNSCEDNEDGETFTQCFNRIIKSLQQPTEIEVEIEMEDIIQLKKRAGGLTNMGKPKLDSNGCLILKKI